jgi:predicted dehydrogenase
MKKRIAIAGAGTRALCFGRAILGRVKDYSEMVALYDTNDARMDGFNTLLKSNVPKFTDFDEMVRVAKPDTLIVCVPDSAHPEVIEKGFAAGLNIITEKPMAMNREGIERIRQTEIKYGKEVTVAFNMRFAPYSAAIKKIMKENPIGKITNVNAEWMIDRYHGQQYFHRWHADISKSGGLLVHKATHHFDLINWFLDDEPESVYAIGSLEQFGASNDFRGDRCTGCPHAKKCWAVLESTLEDGDLNPGSDGEIFNELYFKAEHIDGYFRDQCCFSPDIDIYDTMAVTVQYDKGTVLTYSLNATTPYEGWHAVINGSKGRLEIHNYEAGCEVKSQNHILFYDLNNNVTDYAITKSKGGHGGGDVRLRKMLFLDNVPDPMGHSAGTTDGAYSILIGVAANKSIKTGTVVDIEELLK